MSDSLLRCGPESLLTVSAAPRFLSHSGGVGWQGALFTELVTAPAGVVDHAHEHFCLRRTQTAYRRRIKGQTSWQWVPVGWSLWRPGEEQRSEWEGAGRRQFVFVATSRIEEVVDSPLRASEQLFRPESVPVVQRLFDAMATDLATGSPAGPLVGDCLITALCACLFTPHAGAAPIRGMSGAARQRVLDRIEQDLHRPLALADLAAEAGLGVRQFCRAFRVSTGTSPYQYVLGQRIERARHLITAGTPLAEVASQCGFADQSQLTRLFSRYLGLSPAAYRRTLRR